MHAKLTGTNCDNDSRTHTDIRLHVCEQSQNNETPTFVSDVLCSLN